MRHPKKEIGQNNQNTSLSNIDSLLCRESTHSPGVQFTIYKPKSTVAYKEYKYEIYIHFTNEQILELSI